MSSTFIVPVQVSASQLSFKLNQGLRLDRCETITKEDGRKERKGGQTNFAELPTSIKHRGSWELQVEIKVKLNAQGYEEMAPDGGT